MSVAEGWAVALAGAAAYAFAAARLNPLCLALSPIPLFVFALYPLLKRVTPLCHFGVGAALALSPLGGYLAVVPDLGAALREAGPLALFTLGWVAGFDLIYATLDVDFDRANGVHSLPARDRRREGAVGLARVPRGRVRRAGVVGARADGRSRSSPARSRWSGSGSSGSRRRPTTSTSRFSGSTPGSASSFCWS